MTTARGTGSMGSRRTVPRGVGAGGLAGLLTASGSRLATAQTATPTGAVGSRPPVLKEPFAACEEADAGRMTSLFTPDAVYKAPPTNNSLRGAATIGRSAAGFARAHNPLSTVTPILVIAEPDGAAVDIVVAGTYVGQFPTIPKGNGQPIRYHVAALFTFAGGKISYWANPTDYLTILRQIGVLPPAATPAASATPAP